MMTKRITIIEVKDYVGQEVTIGAWVANKSGKGKIAFLQLRDGTAFFQGVAFKPNFIEKFGEEVGLEKFDTIKRLSQETSVFVTGDCQRRRTFKIWLRVGYYRHRSHR